MEFSDSRSSSMLLALDDTPATADDIDLDRVVWDPAYRSSVRDLLVTDFSDD